MRTFNGKILLRVPPEIHKELAREAFESGRSISQLCMEAILARKALKNYDPWRSVEKLWGKNREVEPAKLTAEIRQAIKEARRAR
ncbi:MAG: toxin-antitoxin system HicB family antitoxin [Elusimicrobia bacterium]|nr:toxin-antitoxin system HicB family antitoxin [Elusimicrobiota bacterium]